MKCIHGNEIKVILEPNFIHNSFIKLYDGNQERNDDGDFIKLIGCEHCKLIGVVIEDYVTPVQTKCEK